MEPLSKDTDLLCADFTGANGSSGKTYGMFLGLTRRSLLAQRDHEVDARGAGSARPQLKSSVRKWTVEPERGRLKTFRALTQEAKPLMLDSSGCFSI